ncbi:MAG: hypothetical protein KKD35_04340 [Elusimicrobia bacterium]|nr:hypothetical protein [Elusimicrobiota bacterium]
MRYWFYSDGNILGPYSSDELMGLPAFGNGSLVCSEDSTGDNPDDWKAADSVPEIANVLSVGAGQFLSSENSYISNAYSLETGFSTRAAQNYFDAKSEDLSPGNNLLDTIDTILGAYDKGRIKENEIPDIDYNLADKFDVKLSKLQEELEASKWEKNLLLEKMKIKDTEEKINQEKISELEEKLNNAISMMEKISSSSAQGVSFEKKGITAGKIEDVSQEAEHKADADERLRKEQASFENELAAELKKMAKSTHISSQAIDHVLGLKKFSNEDIDTSDTDHIVSNKLKSLGYAKSKRIFEEDYRKKTSDTEQSEIEDIAPHIEQREEPQEEFRESKEKALPKQEIKDSLSIDSSAMMYDFTAVTPKYHSSRHEENTITIEENKGSSFTPESKPAPIKQETPEPVEKKEKITSPKPSSGGYPFIHPETAAPKQEPEITPVFSQPAPAEKLVDTNLKPADIDSKEAPLEDKTERILLKPKNNDKPVKTEAPQTKKIKKSSMMLVTVVIVFGAIVAGGLGFFFMGDGSLSDFSLMSFSSKKTVAKTPEVEKTQPKTAPVAEVEIVVPTDNENVRMAINIVKNHKLAGGRGSVSTWLSNSFLSGSSSGLNEEWSATILHKDVFVTQYRLLRQRKEPIIYQFEVDVKKGEMVRGINNNAIELLDFPSKKQEVEKPVSKKKSVKTVKPKNKKLRALPQLPLPAPPTKNFKQEEPSGFENITLSANDKVRYIRAQESDEELF